jgi:glycosyltransferase involved in cell wall biosynthesis
VGKRHGCFSRRAEILLEVLALVPYALGTAPSQRYRFEQWHPYLEACGVRLTFAPFAGPSLQRALYLQGRVAIKARGVLRSLFARIGDTRRAARFDAVVVHREACLLGPAWVEHLVARRVPVVFDFDDAIWLPNVSETNKHFAWLKSPSKTETICRLAATVSVGNEYLADYAGRFCNHVSVVPSTVDLGAYPVAPHRHSGSPAPVIGWTGSHSSLRYLEGMRGVLRELARRREFKLLVIGVEGFEVPGVAVECRSWCAQTEAQDLHAMDIGIMPLTDDRWSRGKCAMKAIQYMAAGIPAVVSPVGANKALVTHDENGLLASSHEEWIEALERLLLDPDARRRLGDSGRETVQRSYSAEVQAPRVAALIRRAVERARTKTF